MILNAICIASNEFCMPAHMLDYTDLSAMPDNGYIEMSPRTNLNILGDWIKIKGGFMSIGDVLLFAGVWVAVLQLNFS